MRSVTILVAILAGSFSGFSQSEPITLNTNQNLFAVNEFDKVLSANPSAKPAENITLFVDAAEQTTFEFRSHIFPRELEIYSLPDGRADTTVLIGSRIIQALPVYISYYGTEQMRISIQDNRFVAVQQAMDSSGNWVSLEHFIHSECGNSYSGVKLNKNESCLFKIAKYSGNYPTKLRLKLLINEQIIYSNEFIGNINYEQFNSDYNKTESEVVFR